MRPVEMWTRGQDDQRGDGYRQEEYEQKDAIQDQAHLPRRTQCSLVAVLIRYILGNHKKISYLFPLEVKLLSGVRLGVSKVGLVDRRGEFGQHTVEARIVERFVH